MLFRAQQNQEVHHPNIIRYHDVFEHTDRACGAVYVVIVMPFFPYDLTRLVGATEKCAALPMRPVTVTRDP